MQLEPPTLSLGVPTIWMSLIQTFDAAQENGSPNHGRWKLPAGMRSLVGGAAVPESLIRAFDRHGIWILQGFNIAFLNSFMANDRQWALWGALLALVGAAQIYWSNTRART